MTVEALPATKPVSILRALVDLRERQIQKARIQFRNRLAAIQRGADDPSKGQIGVVTRYYEALSNLEQKISDDIERIVSRYPIYGELAAIKGIGPQLAAKMLAHIDRQIEQQIQCPFCGHLDKRARFGYYARPEPREQHGEGSARSASTHGGWWRWRSADTSVASAASTVRSVWRDCVARTATAASGGAAGELRLDVGADSA